MARASVSLENFNGGEWTPKLHSSTQLEGYGSALARCFNMVPLIQRAAVRRWGTYFVCEARDSMKRGRLMPFSFGLDDNYAIEMCDAKFRFLKDRGRIELGGSPVEIDTPYALADLPLVKRTQDSDQLYLWHPEKQTRKLTRSSHTDWETNPVAWIDGPYLDENDTETLLTPSGTSGTITVTASHPDGDAAAKATINDGQGFLATDVGRPVRMKRTNWSWVRITSVPTELSFQAEVLGDDLADTTGTTAWRLGGWSGTTGYAACGTFWQGRLWAGYSFKQPTFAWGSGSLRPEDQAPTEANGQVDDDNAISLPCKGEEVNAVQFLAGARVLVAGTTDTEFSIQGAATNGTLTPENKRPQPESAIGAASLEPVIVGDHIFMVNADRTKLYAITPRPQTEGYPAIDASLYGEHIARVGLGQPVYQKNPWSIIFSALDDGSIGGFTFLPEQQVQGWHRHVLGGRFVEADGRVTHAQCESIAAVHARKSATRKAQTDLYLQVKRTIGGQQKRYHEVTADIWEPEIDVLDFDNNPVVRNAEDAFYVDCGLTFNGWNQNPAATMGLFNASGPGGGWAAGDTAFMRRLGGTTGIDGGTESFTSDDVGREYWFRQRKGDVPVKVKATVRRSTLIMEVEFLTDIPEWLRETYDSRWARCAQVVDGLDHLEGEEVAAWVDGGHHPRMTVSGGQVELQAFAAVAHVGLPQPDPWLETLDLNIGAATGTARGKPKVGIEATISLYASMGAKVGRRRADLQEVDFQDAQDPMDIAPPLFTGNKKKDWPAGWEHEMRVVVSTDQAGPLTVRSIIPDLLTSG